MIKFAGLTCAFYVGLTILFEAAICVLFRRAGLVFMSGGDHPAVFLGLLQGSILGFLWLLSLCAAWLIAARDLNSLFALRPK
jgi:hypothetical protein